MIHRLYILIFVFLMTISIMAQPLQTTVVGEVLDAETGVVLPNVNVYLQGTKIGTTTDQDGFFVLRTQLQRKSTIVISSVGYHKQRFVLQPGQSVGLEVMLVPRVNNLSEVWVLPGENPALPLMQKVRQHRNENQVSTPPVSFQDRQVFLSKIRAKHLRRSLWKSLQSSMWQASDSSFLVPLYFRAQRQNQVSEQMSMMTITDWQQLLVDFDQSPSFYHNTIPFYTSTLISPLALDGNTYYHYYLIDSTDVDGKAYQVDFRTKNPYYPTFNGTMWIDSVTYALRSIDAEIPRQVNLNYLHNLHFCQKFQPVYVDGMKRYQKHQEQMDVTLDFAVKSDSSNLFPSLLIMQSTSFADTLDKPSFSSVTPDSLVNYVKQAASSPIFKWASFLAYVYQSGYIPMGGYVELGKLKEILRINSHEKVRLALPLRTTERLSRVVCLEAFAAYGFGDRAWKGAGQLHLAIPAPRRHVLSFRYSDEYISSTRHPMTYWYRENSVWVLDQDLTSVLTKQFYRGSNLRNMDVRKQEFRIDTENDWTDYMETFSYVAVGRSGYGAPSSHYGSQPTFLYSSLGTTLRFGWDERKIDRYFHRVHIHSDKPILYMNAEMGSVRASLEESYNLYGRVRLMLHHWAPLGVVGRLEYAFEAGVLFGRTPYSMLHVFAGNQSYSFSPYEFTLMHNGQYAADRYLQLHAEWNGRGCLFNLIPGIRYLRLRELLAFKLAYGVYSSKNILPLALDNPYTDLRVPYVEVGVGIGNILRVADLYSVWRLTHRSDPGAPVWSMRFRLHVDF